MLRLHVAPADARPFDQPLAGESLVIGRSSDADLVLADRYLSRKHARLYRRGDRWLVEDLGSRNGTFLNGERLAKPAALAPGDVIKLSASVISVHPFSDSGRTRSHEALTTLHLASDLLDKHLTPNPAEIRGEAAWRRQAEHLELLNEVHRALSRSMGLDELLGLILDRVFQHLQPEEAAVILKRPDGGYYRAASRPVSGLEGEHLHSRSLIREVVEKGQAALVLDVQADERFAGASSILASGVRSLVAAPLLDPEGPILGMIALNSRVALRQFDEDDLELLVSLASAAALRIRNLSLAGEAAERRRLEGELALARRIQVGLLPDRLPEVPGYEIHGGNVPSRGVSGDFYQVIERLDGRECVLMVSDVSGKGLGGSLLTASLLALSADPIQNGLPPDEICSRLSRLLLHRTSDSRFATAFLAVLDIASGTIRYASAGHNPALVVRASGEVERLDSTGLPLGLLPVEEYGSKETELAPGDILLLYTDGIVEATSPDSEDYGLGRLIRVSVRHRGRSLKKLAETIEADLESFVQGQPFADDRTLVLVRRLSE